MYDSQTLELIEKFIDKRIEKAETQIKIFRKGEINYTIYKDIILELKHVRDYIRRKK